MRAKFFLMSTFCLVAIFAGAGFSNGFWSDPQARAHAADGIKAAFGLPYGNASTDAPITYHLAQSDHVGLFNEGNTIALGANQNAAPDETITLPVVPPAPPMPPVPPMPQAPPSPENYAYASASVSAEGIAHAHARFSADLARVEADKSQVRHRYAEKISMARHKLGQKLAICEEIVRKLEAGNFTRISVQGHAQAPRCGSADLLPGCESLTRADQTRILVQARLERNRARAALRALSAAS